MTLGNAIFLFIYISFIRRFNSKRANMSGKSKLKIYPKTVICDDESVLIGEVTISSGCVIHPHATVHAKSGPIIIGENCLIEEYATIIHDTGSVDLENPGPTLVIGPNNVFEVGCTVEASAIGERNVFECKSYVSNLVTVSNNCVIGAGCKLVDEHHLPENTVIYGRRSEQRETIEKQKALSMQLDHLRKVLPNYHHIKKPTFDPKKPREIA